MSNKVLTISVAAYNVEAFIDQALRSVCVDAIIDRLEIFVIDDGGADGTLDIAKRYAERYPASVFPVNASDPSTRDSTRDSLRAASFTSFPALFPQAAVPAIMTTVSVPASSFFTILLFIVLSSFQSFTLRIHQKNLVMRILRQRSKSLRLGCSVFLFLSSGDKAFSFRLKSKARPYDQRIECHEDGRQHDKDREHGDQRSAGHHNAQ